MPQLSAGQIVLPRSTVDVVIRRVAVDEPIQEEGVEGESPVGRRRVVRYSMSVCDSLVLLIGEAHCDSAIVPSSQGDR